MYFIYTYSDTIISLDSPSPPSSPVADRGLPTSSSDLNTEIIQALSYGDPTMAINPFTTLGDIAATAGPTTTTPTINRLNH